MSNKYRKKPAVIEAVQFTGENQAEVNEFADNINVVTMPGRVAITTREGIMTAQPGDWIIRGVAGELYPCNPDIFAATYEPVGDPS